MTEGLYDTALKVRGKGEFVDVFESEFGSKINGGAATLAILSVLKFEESLIQSLRVVFSCPDESGDKVWFRRTKT